MPRFNLSVFLLLCLIAESYAQSSSLEGDIRINAEGKDRYLEVIKEDKVKIIDKIEGIFTSSDLGLITRKDINFDGDSDLIYIYPSGEFGDALYSYIIYIKKDREFLKVKSGISYRSDIVSDKGLITEYVNLTKHPLLFYIDQVSFPKSWLWKSDGFELVKYDKNYWVRYLSSLSEIKSKLDSIDMINRSILTEIISVHTQEAKNIFHSF